MEYDELELDTLGEQKTALFVIISDTDATFNFVVSIMYSQLFNLLCDKADQDQRALHHTAEALYGGQPAVSNGTCRSGGYWGRRRAQRAWYTCHQSRHYIEVS